ncbi:MAG: phosphotransferase family protein, partial [Actinobacteria bacterium]|nr:phosphotransferase family protein [Actinomycetota bacterium]
MDDLIPVRADEAFDIEAVTGWLSGNALLSSRTPMVSQFGGGKANLTYLLSFDDGSELVLRRPPLGPVAEGSHDMSREYRVLSRLWKVFEKAPRALALCEDPSVIGGPFLVMERRQGVVVRGVIPDRFGGGLDQTVNRQLSTVVVDTLVELHAVDP